MAFSRSLLGQVGALRIGPERLHGPRAAVLRQGEDGLLLQRTGPWRCGGSSRARRPRGRSRPATARRPPARAPRGRDRSARPRAGCPRCLRALSCAMRKTAFRRRQTEPGSRRASTRRRIGRAFASSICMQRVERGELGVVVVVGAARSSGIMGGVGGIGWRRRDAAACRRATGRHGRNRRHRPRPRRPRPPWRPPAGRPGGASSPWIRRVERLGVALGGRLGIAVALGVERLERRRELRRAAQAVERERPPVVGVRRVARAREARPGTCAKRSAARR